MIVVDSSAFIAMFLNEETAGQLLTRLAVESDRLMSVASYVETGTVLAARRRDRPASAIEDLDRFRIELALALAPVDEEQAHLALRARIQFGRGMGHGGMLNFGDCFSYALARSRRAPLLFVGDDFSTTDVEVALRVVSN